MKFNLTKFLLLSTCVLLVSCNSNGSISDDETLTITFAGRGEDSEKANYIAFLNEYKEINPNVNIVLKWYSSESAYNRALEGSLKKLPDLFMLSDDQFIPYVKGGFLYDYKSTINMEELETQIYPYAAEAYCYNTRTNLYGWDADDPDCGFYGYPKDQGPYALMYNKTLFNELSSEYNEGKPSSEQIKEPSAYVPYTYDEFKTVCKALKDTYYKRSSAGKDFYPCCGYDLDSAVYSNNANFFNETATEQCITSENFIEAIEFYASLYTEGIIAPYGGNVTTGETAFINGKSIFYYAGPWKCKEYWSDIASFEWDLTPVCKGTADGALSMAYVGSMGYVISEKSTVKEAAVELAKYLATNEESQRSQYKRGQCIPNLFSLNNEFRNDTKSLLTDKCPKNRYVWLNVIDGYGDTKTIPNTDTTYVDEVTGRYRPGRYTFSSTWRSDIANYFGGIGGDCVWRGEISARAACQNYASTFQDMLDDLQSLMLSSD